MTRRGSMREMSFLTEMTAQKGNKGFVEI